MNPSLCGGRSVIVRIRIAVVPKDRLAIIPSLPHRIRVAECNGLGNPWHARSLQRTPRIVTIVSVRIFYFTILRSDAGEIDGCVEHRHGKAVMPLVARRVRSWAKYFAW